MGFKNLIWRNNSYRSYLIVKEKENHPNNNVTCISSVTLKMSGNAQPNKALCFISSRGPLALKVIKLLAMI